MSMIGARVPNELFSEVFSNIVDRDTLLKLLLVSRSVHHEAERAIYHTLDYNKIPLQLKKMLSDGTSPFCKRIAPMVRQLSISIAPWGIPDPFCQLILENLFNLQTLHLFHLPNIGSLLRGCSFRLRMLNCSVPFDADWFHFLQTQTELVHLTWNSSKIALEHLDDTDLPSLVFPKLRILGGDDSVIQALLPTHHSITNVSLHSSTAINVSPSFGVQALAIGRHPSQQYRTLADQFPTLHYLHGALDLTLTKRDVINAAEDLTACIDQLQHLEKLQLLICGISISEREFLASKLVGRHARLRRVEILNGGGEWRDPFWINDKEHGY